MSLPLRALPALLLVTAASGCRDTPFCLLCGDAAGRDAEPDACEPDAVEVCNERDDNCDGTVDEGFDLAADPENCGECGLSCALPSAAATCRSGECVVARCAPGTADIDGEEGNGCEATCSVSATVTSDWCDGADCCDGADNDCDGQDGEDHDTATDPGNCGGCSAACETFPCPRVCEAPFATTECRSGSCVVVSCETGRLDLDGEAATGCEYACTPTGDESCNGIDDDCDGITDEAFAGDGDPCGPDEVGECRKGTLGCVGGAVQCVGQVVATPESCNGLDDDCDGPADEEPVDEGTPCETSGEGCDRGRLTCSGGDLVCDEESSPLGQSCGSAEGLCATGIWTCDEESETIECSDSVRPATETCNGEDDDCDGQVDETLGLGELCGTVVGSCWPGRRVCDALSQTLRCEGEVGPVAESCNGVDDDCNGRVDDGLPLGEPCREEEAAAGRLACWAGRTVCVGFVPARGEWCDGADNDNDGDFDEGAPCLGEGVECTGGRCIAPCASNEGVQPCPAGLACRRGVCVGAACSQGDCGECEQCDPTTARCIDACSGLACPPGLVCSCGRCWPPSCATLGCPQGEVCAHGRCQADLCAGADCDDDEGCSEGRCFDICTAGQCGSGQRCERGHCVEDLCAGVRCDQGRCDPTTGECSTRCLGTECMPGTACDLATGTCADDPCLAVRCPEGTQCQRGSCHVVLIPPPPDGGPEPDVDGGDGEPSYLCVVATGGGGAACAATPGRTLVPLGILLLAALAWGVWRRRE